MNEDPLIGRRLANFRVERLIGRGGMARVYYGRDENLQRPVAIKVIDTRHRGNTAIAQRFIQEARSVASWRHESIIQVYYASDQDGLYYFVMEYIDGLDLATLLAQYTSDGELMPHEDVLRIGRAIAGALDFAHQKGVIHRDVKPANIMVASDGRVILTDFGLALVETSETLGTTFGTPQYVAPEQARNSADAVPQSDLYALGVILFEMLTGVIPFDDPSPASLMLQHLTVPPPSPRSINPMLNEETEQVLLKILSKSPEDRYITGSDLLKSLENALTTRPAPSSSGALPPLPAAAGFEETTRLSHMSVHERVALHVGHTATPAYKPQSSAAMQAPTKSQPPLVLAGLGALGVLVIFIPLVILFLVLSGDDDQNSSESPSANENISIVDPSATSQALEPTVTLAATQASTETPTATIATTETSAPSATATRQASATNNPQVVTYVSVPPTDSSAQIGNTPLASATVAQNTAAALPTMIITAAPNPNQQQPTIAYPNGKRLELLYDNYSFYVWNPGSQSLNMNSIAFEVLDAAGTVTARRFEGRRWTQFYAFVEPSNCMVIEITQSPSWLRPTQCRARNAVVNPTATDQGIFWVQVGNDSTAQFRVLWNNQEVARCPLSGQVGTPTTCEVYVP